MADNVQAEAVVTPGPTFATDDNAGVHHPYCKLEWGADGTFTKVDTGAGAIPIQDGGNSITVDGTFYQATQPVSAVSLPLPTGAATAALQTQPGVDIGDVTVNNGAGASAVNIQDGGNSITVDGTVTVSAGTNLNTSALALETTLGTTNTQLGIVTEAAPATDTASSGLNGRLQRIAQRLTSLIALLPAALVGGRLDVNLGAAPATVTVAALPAGTNLIGYVGHGKTLKSKTGTASATFTVVAAVASKKIKVYSLSFTTVSATPVTITMKDGAAGTALATYILQAPTSVMAGIAEAVSVPSQLFETTAATLLEMSFSAAVSVLYNLRYWDDDAT